MDSFIDLPYSELILLGKDLVTNLDFTVENQQILERVFSSSTLDSILNEPLSDLDPRFFLKPPSFAPPSDLTSVSMDTLSSLASSSSLENSFDDGEPLSSDASLSSVPSESDSSSYDDSWHSRQRRLQRNSDSDSGSSSASFEEFVPGGKGAFDSVTGSNADPLGSKDYYWKWSSLSNSMVRVPREVGLDYSAPRSRNYYGIVSEHALNKMQNNRLKPSASELDLLRPLGPYYASHGNPLTIPWKPYISPSGQRINVGKIASSIAIAGENSSDSEDDYRVHYTRTGKILVYPKGGGNFPEVMRKLYNREMSLQAPDYSNWLKQRHRFIKSSKQKGFSRKRNPVF